MSKLKSYYSLLGLSLCLLYNQAVAQSFLVKSSGKIIPFDVLEIQDGYVELENNDELKIGFSEIYGFFSSGMGHFYYKKEVPNRELNRDEVLFIKGIAEGEINLYYDEQSSMVYIPTDKYRNRIKIFLERDDDIFIVFDSKSDENQRKQSEMMFAEVMADIPKAVSILQKSSYQHDKDDIIEIVRQFNTTHALKHEAEYTMTNEVELTYKKKKRNKEPLRFRLSNEEYILSSDTTIIVNIPTGKAVPICGENKGQEQCDVLVANKFYVKNYEIGTDKKDGFWVMKPTPVLRK